MVSAAVGAGSSQRKARFSGLLKPLYALASAGVHSFDRLLAGMVAAGQGIEALCSFLRLTRAALDDHLVRLGLPAPHDRPLRKVGRRGWSVAETTLLIVWRLAGVHCEVIGRVLGRTVGAVRGKAWRTGVPAPARWLLHRPDPDSLRDPEPGLGLDREPWKLLLGWKNLCGRAAGAARVRFCGDSSEGRSAADRASPRDNPAAWAQTIPMPAATAVVRNIPPAAEPAGLAPSNAFSLDSDASPGVPSTPAEKDQAAGAGTETTESPAPPVVIDGASAAGVAVASAPARHQRGASIKIARAAGQCELPLPGVVGGTSASTGRALAVPAPLQAACPTIPRTVGEVDLNGDLTWFRSLKRRQTYEIAVYACGMLFFGGLHWKEVARRFGVTPGTLRTFRSRARVPVDLDRSRIRLEFDERVARATCEGSGYMLRESMGAGDRGSGLRKWFWVHKSELRSTHFAPVQRRRESYEPRRNLMTIMIEAASGRAPQRSFERASLVREGVTASA